MYVYRGRVNAGGQEKGVDVGLALDLVRATYERRYEAAIIAGKDRDFGPAVRLAEEIAKAQGRRLVFESCFPLGPGSHSRRGVPGTTWIPIDQPTYDSCHDPGDYRPPSLLGQTVLGDARLLHDVRQMLPWVDRMSRVGHGHLSLQSRPPAARAPRERPRSATAAMISTSATGT